MNIGDQPKPDSESNASQPADDAVPTDDPSANTSGEDVTPTASVEAPSGSPDAGAAASAADEATRASDETQQQAESSAGESSSAGSQPAPLSKAARGTGPLAARGLGVAKPASPQSPVGESALAGGAAGKTGGGKSHQGKPLSLIHI